MRKQIRGEEAVKKYPWQQLEEETAYEYQLFCYYISLKPRKGKRGTELRRHPTDVAKQFNISIQQVSGYKAKYEWETRAQAYDEFMANPEAVELLTKRRVHAEALETMGDKLIDKATKAIEKIDLDNATVAELNTLIKLGLLAKKEAEKTGGPVTEDAKEGLVNGILTELTGLFADANRRNGGAGEGLEIEESGVFGSAPGSDQVAPDSDGADEIDIGVRPVDVPEESALLCEGDPPAEMVARPAADSIGDNVLEPSDD